MPSLPCLIGLQEGGGVPFRTFRFDVPLARAGRALMLHWRAQGLVSALVRSGLVGATSEGGLLPGSLSSDASGPDGVSSGAAAFWESAKVQGLGAFLFVDGRWEMAWPDGRRERVVEALVRLDKERALSETPR